MLQQLDDCMIAVRAKPKMLAGSSVFSSTAPRQVELDFALQRYATRLPAPKIKPREIGKGEKWCCHCGDVRGKQMFHNETRSRDGKHSHCKTCRNEYARFKYYLKSLEKQAA